MRRLLVAWQLWRAARRLNRLMETRDVIYSALVLQDLQIRRESQALAAQAVMAGDSHARSARRNLEQPIAVQRVH